MSVPERIQGKSLAKALDDPEYSVRDMAFSVNVGYRIGGVGPLNGMLLRSDRWAYIQYGEKAENGIELFDMHKDPKQYTNLAKDPKYKNIVGEFQKKLAQKVIEARSSDVLKSQ